MSGWDSYSNYGFTNRQQHPFTRSFTTQGETAVVTGWTCKNGRFSEELYCLRKSFETVNLLHKWHKDGYRDNDFYFVTGTVAGTDLSRSAVDRAAEEVRRVLSENGTNIKLGKSTISIAAYADPHLPPETTRTFAINDPELTPELLRKLYHQGISS